MKRPESLSTLTPAQRLDLEELQEKLTPDLERCVRSGEYLIAVVTCDEKGIRLEGLTQEFPIDRFDAVMELIRQKLDAERERIVAGEVK